MGEGPEAEAKLEKGSFGSQGKKGFQEKRKKIVSTATKKSNKVRPERVYWIWY